MIKNFVDHFKTKEFGFNFFPVLGMIAATMLAEGLKMFFLALEGLIKSGHAFSYQTNVVPAISSLLFGLGLILVVHLTDSDILLPVLYGLVSVVLGFINRLIYCGSYSLWPAFYRDIRLSAYLFSLKSIIGNLLYALAIALALVIIFKVLKRLDLTLLLAFPVGGILFQIYNLISGGFSIRWFFYGFVEDVITGILFYIGYSLFMRARSWQVSGKEFKRLGEETSQRTDWLPKKIFFAFPVILIVMGLLILYLATSLMNYRWMQLEFPSEALNQHWLSGFNINILLILVLFSAIAGAAIAMAFVRRMWMALQDGNASATPGKALGFLFIPVFNLYWFFKVFYGFSKEYNTLSDRHRLNVPKLPNGLYLAFCILSVLNIIISLPLLPFTEDLQAGSANLSIIVILAVLQTAVSLAVLFLTCQAVIRIPEEIYRRGPSLKKMPT